MLGVGGCFDCWDYGVGRWEVRAMDLALQRCWSWANRVASDAGMFVRKVTYLAFKEGFRIAST